MAYRREWHDQCRTGTIGRVRYQTGRHASAPLLEDAALAATLQAIPGSAGPARTTLRSRALLQQRWTDPARRIGRTVERVRLGTGEDVLVKSRNDRPTCRETLFYRHLFAPSGVAGTLVPRYLGSHTTGSGVLVLVLEYVAGRAPDWRNAADRSLAVMALAAFHARFIGLTLAEISPALCQAPLAGEAIPDPAEAALPTLDDPLVLDPGDVRPENVILVSAGPGQEARAVLIDFENVRVRRRSAALATISETLPPCLSGQVTVLA